MGQYEWRLWQYEEEPPAEEQWSSYVWPNELLEQHHQSLRRRVLMDHRHSWDPVPWFVATQR